MADLNDLEQQYNTAQQAEHEVVRAEQAAQQERAKLEEKRDYIRKLLGFPNTSWLPSFSGFSNPFKVPGSMPLALAGAGLLGLAVLIAPTAIAVMSGLVGLFGIVAWAKKK